MKDIINKNYKELLAYCYKLTISKEDAEDLLHDVVVKLYENKERYTYVNKSFIYVVIKNYFIDQKRKDKNTKDLLQLDEGIIEDVSEDKLLRYIDEASNCLTFLEYGLLTDNSSLRQLKKDYGIDIRRIKTIRDNAKLKLKAKWEEVESQKVWAT